MEQYCSDFTDPLDEILEENNNFAPEPYLSTPNQLENLRKTLFEEGFLVHLH